MLPDKIAISKIAKYYGCAVKSQILVFNPRIKLTKKVIEEGSQIDHWLKSRPKCKSDQILLNKLEPHRPYHRQFRGVELWGDFDDLNVVHRVRPIENRKRKVRLVRFIENKSVGVTSIDDYFVSFVICEASLQLKAYCWLYESLLTQFGYLLDVNHFVRLWNRSHGYQLGYHRVIYTETDLTHELDMIFDVYEGKRPLIKPKEWKCKRCEPIFKNQCPLWKVKES